MRVFSAIVLLSFATGTLSGCIKRHFDIVNTNETDATLVLQYEHGFEKYTLQWSQAEKDALEQCEAWGYSQVEFSEAGLVDCIETHHRKVTGARPPGQSAEPGMGTQAAERERMRRGVGTVGKSVGRTPPAGTEYGCVYWRVTYTGHCFD